MPPARPKELQPYRIFMYVVYSVIAAAASLLILRSVVKDLFARARPGQAAPATAAACLGDVERLSGSLSARAAQPTPLGLATEALSLEWDQWSRGWEDDLAAVSARCTLGPEDAATSAHLAAALEGLEELRRGLLRSGLEAGADSRRVKAELAAARASLRK